VIGPGTDRFSTAVRVPWAVPIICAPIFAFLGLWDCQDLAEHQVKRSSFKPRISRPKQIEELYLKLPETSRKAIEDRDKPTTKTS